VNFDLDRIPTPCYVIDEAMFEKNLRLLDDVQDRSGCTILLALKAFSLFSFFSLARRYLGGTSASSLHEARLGREEFGGELHVCSPAYGEEEFAELLSIADCLVFNSLSQWTSFRPLVDVARRPVKCGIRINPEHSEVEVAAYDPCRRFSRLGVTAGELGQDAPEGITGLHFHSLCELGSDALERTLETVETGFGRILEQVEWLNLGGGQLITAEGYETDKLCELVKGLSARYGVRVYLEPGEAVALDAGVLVATVLDIMRNERDIAILDTSATAHMPDVLEMPYRPGIEGAGEPGEKAHSYVLGGVSCLAGDVIGEYSFDEPLEVGSRIVFRDMAHYTMVKNTTFNGIRLPSIASWNSATGDLRLVREFGYEDYRGRLGPAG